MKEGLIQESNMMGQQIISKIQRQNLGRGAKKNYMFPIVILRLAVDELDCCTLSY